MKDWIHFKEEREKARQYVEKMTKSAIIVQAWWRGLLVRRQLGPYKIPKKKGGGKKK
jgi:IQ domain-containing protein G